MVRKFLVAATVFIIGSCVTVYAFGRLLLNSVQIRVTPTAQSTVQVAQILTLAVPARQALATQTPEATLTPTPTDSPTPTSTPVMAVVQTDALNIREGPGTNYPIIGGLQNGDTITVTGRLDDSSWYQIRVTEGGYGWVSSALVKLAIPVNQIALAPTPTPRPTPTASATPNREATLTAVGSTNATATLEAYRSAAPIGTWCDVASRITVCVYQFRYFWSSSVYSAGSGHKFVGFGINVMNEGRSTIHVNPLYVTLVDFDGTTYSYDVVTFDYFITPLPAVNVLPGDKAGGGIAFKIRVNSAPAKVVYQIGLLDPTVIIDLKRAPDSR